MEHRVKTAYPVAKIATASKAYKLEAKYMRYGAEMGIMISYVRREPKRASDRMAGCVVPPIVPTPSLTGRSPVQHRRF
jgi:hypothetical protein